MVLSVSMLVRWMGGKKGVPALVKAAGAIDIAVDIVLESRAFVPPTSAAAADASHPAPQLRPLSGRRNGANHAGERRRLVVQEAVPLTAGVSRGALTPVQAAVQIL
jgi:hypothetical protein